MERTEREKLLKANAKTEAIRRRSTDPLHPTPRPVLMPRTSYPWEAELNLPRITKEFFRCKGSQLHPAHATEPPLVDCEGPGRHGLPILGGKEGIYPLLIDLLNYVQKRTLHRAIITCGHRCPVHNTYSDPSEQNRTSKHQIGAEVDFYVQGMEERPQEVAGLILQYFKETAPYSTDSASKDFKQIDPYTWQNQELLLRLVPKDQGRDFDNRHPHPYLTLQVRFDRATREKVAYSWAKANQAYAK